MKTNPTHAMVLAAGRGERMRPLTEVTPKPLIPVAGQPMIDRVLDRVAAAGVETVVVNLHHLPDQLERHLANRREFRLEFSKEEELLDTGGGVRKALPSLGDAPFFVLNGDILWQEGRVPALTRLAETWDEATMDALLLVLPLAQAQGYDGTGDFRMDPLGVLCRRGGRQVAPFVFAGIQILHPRLFDDAPEGAFSLNLLYDRAIERERLAGLRHDGTWYHVGAPAQIEWTERALATEGMALF